jgi:hypothetical protein
MQGMPMGHLAGMIGGDPVTALGTNNEVLRSNRTAGHPSILLCKLMSLASVVVAKSNALDVAAASPEILIFSCA